MRCSPCRMCMVDVARCFLLVCGAVVVVAACPQSAQTRRRMHRPTITHTVSLEARCSTHKLASLEQGRALRGRIMHKTIVCALFHLE